MAMPTDSSSSSDAAAFKKDGIPELPPDATPEQKDEHWYKYVYQGDKMPQLTVRAVVTGGILGMLMSASNLYTTLTVGWAFGVAITASVISYVIWSILTPIFGGRKMTILETNCMASTASAAGYSTGSTIATMFGALLLQTKPAEGQGPETVVTHQVQPWLLVGAFTLCTGLMGVFLAIPMKRQLINHDQLAFPSGIAAAETLRSLYSGSVDAIRKAYVLIGGLVAGAIVAVLRAGEGTFVFLDKFYQTTKLAIPGQIPEHGFREINGKQLVGFGFDTSLLLTAAGMIVGLRVSLSMLLGSILLYFWLAPMLIAMDAPQLDASGNAFKAGYVPSIELVAGGTVYHVFRWGLWGGTALMVMASLTTLAFQWKTIGRAFTGVSGGSGGRDDLAAIEVPGKWMIIGMVPITIAMIVIQYVAFDIAVWAGIIAVAMSFVLSLVACRATGETDTTPIGAMGKVMQLLFALIKPGMVVPNLASAGIAANSASSSADLLTDLKSGYLLGANPRRQFLAQFFGIFFGTMAIVPIWYLMIPNRAALESGKYPAPATQTWAKVAEVLTKGLSSLPESAKMAIVIGAAVGVLLPLIERFVVPAKYRKYMPSATGLGLSMMLPFANSLSFTVGSLLSWAWGKLSPKSQEQYNVPLASGMIAGESLVAAAIAMLATAAGLMHWQL